MAASRYFSETAFWHLLAEKAECSSGAGRGFNGSFTVQNRSELLAGGLEIGLDKPLYIREERISSQDEACRILYVSDIHLRRRRSDHLIRQVLDAVRLSEPNVVLLGGDMLDERSELGRLKEFIHRLCDFAPVLAIGGNHDRSVGIDQVRDAVEVSGGKWIHDSFASVKHSERTITISGPDTNEQDNGDVRILCAHNPRIWKNRHRQGYDLILAGHLHGCQVVAFEYGNRLFPGAIFYPYCYLRHQCGATKLVVSRGVSDLVPVRWMCPREVVLCYV